MYSGGAESGREEEEAQIETGKSQAAVYSCESLCRGTAATKGWQESSSLEEDGRMRVGEDSVGIRETNTRRRADEEEDFKQGQEVQVR